MSLLHLDHDCESAAYQPAAKVRVQVPYGHLSLAKHSGIGLMAVHLVRRLSSGMSLITVRILPWHTQR